VLGRRGAGHGGFSSPSRGRISHHRACACGAQRTDLLRLLLVSHACGACGVRGRRGREAVDS
jgi:hypothetical protein